MWASANMWMYNEFLNDEASRLWLSCPPMSVPECNNLGSFLLACLGGGVGNTSWREILPLSQFSLGTCRQLTARQGRDKGRGDKERERERDKQRIRATLGDTARVNDNACHHAR